MEEHALRRSLSDELHARAFHDFEGAGRFIRYVFLTETGTDDILAYIDEFLVANGQQPIPEGSKFLRLDLNGFASRVEPHTEFLSVSFIEQGASRQPAFWATRSMLRTAVFRLPGRAAYRPRSFTPSGWKSAASRRAGSILKRSAR